MKKYGYTNIGMDPTRFFHIWFVLVDISIVELLSNIDDLDEVDDIDDISLC